MLLFGFQKMPFMAEFWFRQAGKAHLLVGKPCEAKYAVSAHDKPLPACHKAEETIWFLQFAQKTK